MLDAGKGPGSNHKCPTLDTIINEMLHTRTIIVICVYLASTYTKYYMCTSKLMSYVTFVCSNDSSNEAIEGVQNTVWFTQSKLKEIFICGNTIILFTSEM